MNKPRPHRDYMGTENDPKRQGSLRAKKTALTRTFSRDSNDCRLAPSREPSHHRCPGGVSTLAMDRLLRGRGCVGALFVAGSAGRPFHEPNPGALSLCVAFRIMLRVAT